MTARIAYDTELRRPGCAIVQAAFGCDGSIADAFDTRHWLTAPTPAMAVYPVPDAETLDALVAITEAANP